MVALVKNFQKFYVVSWLHLCLVSPVILDINFNFQLENIFCASYSFCSIIQGRKELMSFMKRRKYKEMMLALLEKKRLRFSQLDIRFHLRDLIGAGLLKTVETPTGLLVRVAKD